MSATLYASIQMFGPESWRHFYYHPSLNPFALPLHLGIFVSFVWAIIIVGLAAVCAVDYVVFSILTLYYVGYGLLVAYVVFAVRCFIHATATTQWR